MGDVAAHFASRWREVEGEQLADTPTLSPAGEQELQVARTVPETRHTERAVRTKPWRSRSPSALHPGHAAYGRA